jgi:hypothetical protein
MQLGEYSRRLRKKHRANEVAGWAKVGPGRPSPFGGPVRPPFDLAANQTIYSPEATSHTRILLSSAAEE